jgi:hypothetical protein
MTIIAGAGPLRPEFASLAGPSLTSRLLRPGRAPLALIPAATPARLRAADEILAGRFTVVGETYAMPAAPDWALNPSRDKEWQIAQHKHPFALDLALAYRERGDPAYLARFTELTEGWLATMGTGFIAASDAQVEAKRVEHWSLAILALAGTLAFVELPPDLLPALLARIGEEAAYILAHLKPARNHRTFQLYSVFLAGALFAELRAADELLSIGAALLGDNLLRDLMPDGVHVELATHYHQLVLETATAFVALARWRGLLLAPALLERVARGLEYSLWMQRPDGSLPLCGDADDGDHRPMLALGAALLGDPTLRYGATLGREGRAPLTPSRHFADGGVFVLGDGWGAGPAGYAARQHVFYDCGPLGEGSHCHYDLFNFTYDVGGTPLVIDPGRYTYDAAPDPAGVDWRHYFKGTPAHNTLTVDRRDQTAYRSKWLRDRQGGPKGGPKHGPQPEMLARAWRLGSHSDWVDATARSAEYTPLHRRLLVFMRRQYLLLVDLLQIDDGAAHEGDLRFHLAPRCFGRVTLAAEADTLTARAPGLQIRVAGAAGIEGRVEDGWVSVSYGVKEPAPVLSFRQVGDRSLAFCSLLAADSAIQVEGFSATGGPAVGWIRCRVAARVGGVPCTDELLVATGAAPADLDEDGLRFRGRHLAVRRDAAGRPTYLCAHGAEVFSLAGGPAWLSEKESLEWSL